MEQHALSSRFIADALTWLQDQQIDVAQMLKGAGFSPALSPTLTKQQYGQLWLALADACNDEFLGMSSHPMRRGSFVLLCQVMLHAGTLEKALSRALKFLCVVLDEPYGQMTVLDGKAHIVLVGDHTPHPALAFRIYWLILLGVSCWLIGRRIPLQRLDFACAAPPDRADYQQFFGVPVHFEQGQTRLIFDAGYLSLPTIRTEEALKRFLRHAPGNLLVRYRHDHGWVTRVRTILKAQPIEAWPDFTALARQLRTTSSTLRRRLHDEGQSFAAIKDDIRSAQAIALLSETTLSIAEIAHQLGFTEPSSFHRAFKLWTDTSPGAYRQGLQEIQTRDDGSSCHP